MKRIDTPRRKRAGTKAWVYLALFGPGDDAADHGSDAGGDDDTADVDAPEE